MSTEPDRMSVQSGIAFRCYLRAMVFVVCAACGGGAGTSPVSYAGIWKGTTSQSKAIAFTVSGNAITTIEIGFTLTGNCSPPPTSPPLSASAASEHRPSSSPA